VAFARGTKAQAANKWTEAAQAFQQATQLDGSFFELTTTSASRNIGCAIFPTLWRSGKRRLPSSPIRRTRATCCVDAHAAGYFPDAAQEAEKLLAANTNDSRAHLLLGNLCAEQLRDKARARAHYQRLLELDARHPSANQFVTGWWQIRLNRERDVLNSEHDMKKPPRPHPRQP